MSKHDDGGPAKDKSLWAEYMGQALAKVGHEYVCHGRTNYYVTVEHRETLVEHCGAIADAMVAEMRKRERDE